MVSSSTHTETVVLRDKGDAEGRAPFRACSPCTVQFCCICPNPTVNKPSAQRQMISSGSRCTPRPRCQDQLPQVIIEVSREMHAEAEQALASAGAQRIPSALKHLVSVASAPMEMTTESAEKLMFEPPGRWISWQREPN